MEVYEKTGDEEVKRIAYDILTMQEEAYCDPEKDNELDFADHMRGLMSNRLAKLVDISSKRAGRGFLIKAKVYLPYVQNLEMVRKEELIAWYKRMDEENRAKIDLLERYYRLPWYKKIWR